MKTETYQRRSSRLLFTSFSARLNENWKYQTSYPKGEQAPAFQFPLPKYSHPQASARRCAALLASKLCTLSSQRKSLRMQPLTTDYGRVGRGTSVVVRENPAPFLSILAICFCRKSSTFVETHFGFASLWPAGYVPSSVLARREQEAERKRNEEEQERGRKEEKAKNDANTAAVGTTKKKKKATRAAGAAEKG